MCVGLKTQSQPGSSSSGENMATIICAQSG